MAGPAFTATGPIHAARTSRIGADPAPLAWPGALPDPLPGMKLPRGASGSPVTKAAEPTATSAAKPGHRGTERALFPPLHTVTLHSHPQGLTESGVTSLCRTPQEKPPPAGLSLSVSPQSVEGSPEVCESADPALLHPRPHQPLGWQHLGHLISSSSCDLCPRTWENPSPEASQRWGLLSHHAEAEAASYLIPCAVWPPESVLWLWGQFSRHLPTSPQ